MAIWNKKIIDTDPELFGLDLSDLSIKVVQLKKKGKYSEIVGMAQANIPQGTIVDSVIIKPEVVVEGIHKAVKAANIAIKDVYCSLPESKAFLRIISIPQMTQGEAAEAIKWEMEANIPMAIDQVYYDWQILPEELHKTPEKMSILVVAIARTVVDQLMSVIEDAGLEVRGFEVESMAQSRSLLASGSSKTTMIVDIGDRRTSFLIVVGDVPVFTSSIPLSAETMTDVISKGLGVSYAEAEKVKFEHGIGSVLKNDHIFQAVKPVIQSFVQEINKSINFYLTGLKYSDSVDTIILCGGGARMKGLIPYLSRSLNRKIELGDPWANTTFKSLPPVDREISAQYVTAIGLASQTHE